MSRHAIATAMLLSLLTLPAAAFDFETLELPTAEARSLVFAPDGSGLFIGDPDGNVRFWDLATGEISIRVKGALGDASSTSRNLVRLLPGGTSALVGYESGVIRHVDLRTGVEHWRIRPFVTQLLSLAVSPDGVHAVTSDLSNRVVLVKVEDGATVWDFKHASIVNDTAFSASGDLIFEAELGRFRVETLEGYLGPFDFELPGTGYSGIDQIDVSKAGIVAGADGGAVHVYDGRSGKRLDVVEPDGESPAEIVAISPDGKRFLTDLDGGVAALYDVKSGKQLGSVGQEREHHDVEALAFSPDSGRFATADSWGRIKLWRTKGLKPIAGARMWSDGWAVFAPDGGFMGEFGEMAHLLSLDGFDPALAEPDRVKALFDKN